MAITFIHYCILISQKEERQRRDQFVTDFNNKYEISDEGDLSHHLGVKYELDRERCILCTHQGRYIDSILAKLGMETCNPKSTPLSEHVKTYKTTDKDRCMEAKHSLYHSIVCSLQYLSTMTQLDISFATRELSRYMADPSSMHLQLAKWVLAYLKGSKECSLTFCSGDKDILSGYSDSTWGNDPETRRSVSGYVFLLHGTAVSWKSKLENTVALSLTEAEYHRLRPTVIYEDNEGCIAMVKNPVSREKAKHWHINIKRGHAGRWFNQAAAPNDN
eukprot:2674684-Rhodomonas_salina.1